MVARKETSELKESLVDPNLNQASMITEQALLILKKKLSFFIWQGFFEPLKPISFNDLKLTLQAPSSFHRNWVIDHYMQELVAAASESFGQPIKVNISANSDISKKDNLISKPEVKCKKISKHEVEIKIDSLKNSLPTVSISAPSEVIKELDEQNKNSYHDNYTFETFVKGPSNQMVFEAAHSVAEYPGTQFSPLFIFGTVGIGKTHLLHAIRKRAKEKDPTLRIIYLSAEAWVNSYVQAIRERKFDSFRTYYRNSCDILLIDDIQFLAGKDASQDEFFHTFNTLHEAKKQIVVTSDKYPHEIEGLEERLQTRLSWGLIADIRPPEIETRLAILHKKAFNLNLDLDREIFDYLASNLTNSVRELEGALLRISAYIKLSKIPICLSKVKEIISPVIKKKNVVVSWQKVCDVVSGHYDIRTTDIIGKSRQKQIVFARQVGMSLCRSLLSMSLPEIGKVFGGRDHTTVLSSVRKIDRCKKMDLSMQSLINKLENKITSMN